MVDYAEIVELSTDEAKQQILDIWAALDITDPLHFGEGSLPGLQLEASAWMANKLSRMAVASKMLTLSEAATGAALTLWSKSVYDHDRYPATAGEYTVLLTCAAGSGPYTLNVGDMVVGSDFATFRLTAPISPATFPLTLAAGAPISAKFSCEEPGLVGAVAPSAINRLVTTYVGVTVLGTSVVVNPRNEESDAALRTRNRTKWATLNPLSPCKDAIVYYAMNTPNVANVARVGVIDTNPRGQYTFDVVLGGQAGPSGSGDVDLVRAYLTTKFLAPFATAMEVYPSDSYYVTPRGTIYYYSGFSEDAVKDAIQVALTNLSTTISIGGDTWAGVNNQLLRAQFEKAIEAATVGEQPCVKLCPLTDPPVATTLGSTYQVVVSTVFGAGYLELVPVLQ
jgi:hypothetical protein